jgi:hypothetical protein
MCLLRSVWDPSLGARPTHSLRFLLQAERRARAAAGRPEHYGPDDLYPDAGPCLAALKDMGLCMGLAGNQTHELGSALRSLGLPVEVIATSAGWGVEKPSPAFFAPLVRRQALLPHRASCPCPGPVLAAEEGEQVGVDFVLVRGGEAVREARVVDLLRAADQPGRLPR